MSSPDNLFPTDAELQKAADKRFADIRRQQDLDRLAAQPQAQEVFGEGTLGRVEEGRSKEIADLLEARNAQLQAGAQDFDASIARRQATIDTGGKDPAFQQIEEAARRAQDVQTQTSLRQLRGDLGSQGVRGGINIQNQLRTLGGANLAESQLQGQLAQARLSRVTGAESALEGLQGDRVTRQSQALSAKENTLLSARADEASRADTNTQRALQERLGRLQITEARAQQGTIDQAAAGQEVFATAQFRAQLAQQAEANEISRAEANKPAPSSGKVLCTELHRQGLISDEILKGDLIYARTVPIETKIGYWVWAKPLANKCKTSKLLAYLALPFVKAWATEMSYKVGVSKRGSFLGKLMVKVFEPACNLLGKTLLKLNLVEQVASPKTLTN